MGEWGSAHAGADASIPRREPAVILTPLQLFGILVGVVVGALVHILGSEPPRPGLKRAGRAIMLLSAFAVFACNVFNVHYAVWVDPSVTVTGSRGGGSWSFATYPAVFVVRAIGGITLGLLTFVGACLWGVHTSRTLYLQWAWWALVAILGLAALVLLYASDWSAVVAFALVGALLAPGLLQRWLYRDFHAAERAHREGRHADAHIIRFLQHLPDRQWLELALWLRWSRYTTQLEAMALNQLGETCLALDDPVEAGRAWRAASEVDEAYPVPYVNLALLDARRGDPFAADAKLLRAWVYGYPEPELAAARSQVQALVDAWHAARSEKAAGSP
jgi:hypothetical protein